MCLIPYLRNVYRTTLWIIHLWEWLETVCIEIAPNWNGNYVRANLKGKTFQKSFKPPYNPDLYLLFLPVLRIIFKPKNHGKRTRTISSFSKNKLPTCTLFTRVILILNTFYRHCQRKFERKNFKKKNSNQSVTHFSLF